MSTLFRNNMKSPNLSSTISCIQWKLKVIFNSILKIDFALTVGSYSFTSKSSAPRVYSHRTHCLIFSIPNSKIGDMCSITMILSTKVTRCTIFEIKHLSEVNIESIINLGPNKFGTHLSLIAGTIKSIVGMTTISIFQLYWFKNLICW